MNIFKRFDLKVKSHSAKLNPKQRVVAAVMIPFVVLVVMLTIVTAAEIDCRSCVGPFGMNYILWWLAVVIAVGYLEYRLFGDYESGQ